MTKTLDGVPRRRSLRGLRGLQRQREAVLVSRGERSKIIELALGRIFGMMQRPFMEGDFEEYECCRAIVLDTIGGDMPPDYRPNYARDRGRRGGAAGGWS
jgi:hypothetical protein